MWAWSICLSLCVDWSPSWLCAALGGGSWPCSAHSRRRPCAKHLAGGGSPGTWQSVSGEHLAGCRCPALVWAAPPNFRRLSVLVEDSTDVVGELCNIFIISSGFFLYLYFFIITITIVPWGSGLLGGLGLLIKDQDFVKPLVLSYSAKPMSSTAVP